MNLDLFKLSRIVPGANSRSFRIIWQIIRTFQKLEISFTPCFPSSNFFRRAWSGKDVLRGKHSNLSICILYLCRNRRELLIWDNNPSVLLIGIYNFLHALKHRVNLLRFYFHVILKKVNLVLETGMFAPPRCQWTNDHASCVFRNCEGAS